MKDNFTTQFWQEQPGPQTPFRPQKCLCAGFDVYGDLIKNASGMAYVYLLLQGEPPSKRQEKLLNGLLIALGNAGPRDYGVQAAMSATAGGAGAAASLIAALSAGAGNYFGSREIFTLCLAIRENGQDLSLWQNYYQNCVAALEAPTDSESLTNVWPASEHAPGFDPHTYTAIEPVQQALAQLAEVSLGPHLAWWAENYAELESVTQSGLSLCAVTAAALTDLGLDPEQSEALYLWMRLPGAMAHGIEQRNRGWKDYPYYPDGVKTRDNN